MLLWRKFRHFFLLLKNGKLDVMSTIFQTKEWEEFKLKTGYESSWWVDDILVLEKRIGPLGSMLYSPLIGSDQLSKVQSQEFINKIKNIAAETGSFFYKIEFDLESSKFDAKEITKNWSLASGKLVKSFEEMQPEHSLLLDISKSEEQLLTEMKQKGRYNIKVAEKHNIKVKACKVSEFFQLYSTMAKRQKITFRGEGYFQKLVDTLDKKGYVKVFGAYAEIKQPEAENDAKEFGVVSDTNSSPKTGEVLLASAIAIFYQDQAIYLFGGSSNELRNYMAPYKLQWEMIKEAKKRGCKTYDFFGISPDDSPKHAWAGVTKFKKQFGGFEREILGSYDLVFSPGKYSLFKMAEKIRRK